MHGGVALGLFLLLLQVVALPGEALLLLVVGLLLRLVGRLALRLAL